MCIAKMYMQTAAPNCTPQSQVALKCADLGHLSSPKAVHLRWVQALEEEFFLQGDNEKQNGLSVSPLMDRDKNGITKSQVWCGG